jgi:hypothetical protein
MLPWRGQHRKYMPYGLAVRATSRSACLPGVDARRWIAGCRFRERTIVMLDVIYLLVGAVFLGACVLYAYACDHL